MVAAGHNQAAHGRGVKAMPKLTVEKSPRKPRKSSIAPRYTRKAPEPCPFKRDEIEAALVRIVNPPAFVAGCTRTVAGVDYTVALYSDDTVRIKRDAVPVAAGRFETRTWASGWGTLSVESKIVAVDPATVPADIVTALSSDLTYFAFRAGRFSGGKGA